MTNLEYNLDTKPRIFVSYASADKAVAKAIVDGLRSLNLDVCLDDYELYPGGHWAESIRVAVSASAYLLVLLSKNSVNFHWLSNETEAVLKELQSRDITFLPVLLEDCDIPLSLASYQWFDMRNGIEENLEKLANALMSTQKIDFEKLSPHINSSTSTTPSLYLEILTISLLSLSQFKLLSWDVSFSNPPTPLIKTFMEALC